MVDNDKALAVPTQPELFVASEDKPIVLRDEMERLGLFAPHMKPEELIGETFIIFKAKSFKSKYDPEFDPYFCNCTDPKHEEVWTVVLGGQALTPIMAAYIGAGVGKPIQVTLGWEEGGAHGGYYVFK